MTSSLKGVHLSMHSAAVNIDYETSALRLYPKVGNTTIQSHIYYDLRAGHVVSISGLPRVKLDIRKASIPLTQIRILKMPFKRLVSKYKLELSELTMMSSIFSTTRNDAYSIILKGTPNYKDLLISINRMKREATFLIDSLIAFKDAVLMTERSRSLIARVKSLTGIIIRQLRQLSGMTIKPMLSELMEINEGLSLSYFGQVCVHSLCFSNNIISIFDLKDDYNCSNNGNMINSSANIYITAISKKARRLGPYFIVQPNTNVDIQMSKTSNDFAIKFPATVAIFNRTFNTTVRINQDKFEFYLRDLSIGYLSVFDVLAKSEFRLTSTWDSIDFFYQGKGNEYLATTLEKMADEIIENVAEKTAKRINDVHQKLQQSKDLIKQYKSDVSALKKDFFIKDRLRRVANQSYIKANVNLTRERLKFHSEVRADLLRNLNRILDAKCTKKECSKVCTTIALHDICQERTMGFAHELHCDHNKKTTRSTVEEGLKTECTMQKKTFVPIYTGTCRKGGQDRLKQSLVETGAGIGGAIGTIWGPVGTAIGTVIGSAAGMFASLFSSCDKSYEVYKQVFNYRVPCVLKVFNTHTKTFIVTNCYTVNHLVIKEYGEPKPCAVSNSSCILTNDPTCLQGNNNCRKQRAKIRKVILEKMNVTNQVWLNMELYELRVAVLFPLMLQARNTATEAKRTYERKVAYLKRAELELKFAQSSIDNIDSYLLLEKCFLRVYKASKQGHGFLKFHDIFFKTPTPDAENILLELFVNEVGSRPKLTEFLYVFEDQITSIKHGLLKILRNHLCLDIYRQRRSIVDDVVRSPESHYVNYPFSEISNNNNKEVKESDIVCINSKTIFTYMQKLTERLRNTTQNALTQRDVIRSSQLNIQQVIDNLKRKRTDSVVNEQLKLMEDARSRNKDELKELSISNVLLNWNQNVELFTGSCNFTSCFNTKDCVKAAIHNMYGLPSMIKVKRSVYATQLLKLEGIFNKIFTRPENLDSLKKLSLELQNSITLLKKMTSFCSRAPEVKLTSLPKVVAFVNDIVELACLSTSDLPLSYNWKHNNKTLLFENQSKLRIFVQNSTTGSYVCESWNRAGRSSSEETFIVLQKKPIVLQQPQDFSYLSTMVTQIKPFFECNVTADPLPKISWYYQSFNEPTHIMKLHSTKSVLNIVKPNVANNGFYYCVASNQYGSAKSRKARLDVLVGELPKQQQLTVAFNLPMNRTEIKKGKYEEKMKKDSQIATTQSLGINMEDAGPEEVTVQVNIDEHSDTNAYGLQDLDLLKKVSISRKSLSEGIQRIVSSMVDTHGHNVVAEMERTMLIGFDGERCSEGHSLHDNGFTCGRYHLYFTYLY